MLQAQNTTLKTSMIIKYLPFNINQYLLCDKSMTFTYEFMSTNAYLLFENIDLVTAFQSIRQMNFTVSDSDDSVLMR